MVVEEEEEEEVVAAAAAERSGGGAAAAFLATTPDTRSAPKHECSEITSFSFAPTKALAAAWARGVESLEAEGE